MRPYNKQNNKTMTYYYITILELWEPVVHQVPQCHSGVWGPLALGVQCHDGSVSGGDIGLQAREARPHVKVIFMSGYAEDHFSDQQAQIPHSVFLQKPFSLSELTEVVQAQFEV